MILGFSRVRTLLSSNCGYFERPKFFDVLWSDWFSTNLKQICFFVHNCPHSGWVAVSCQVDGRPFTAVARARTRAVTLQNWNRHHHHPFLFRKLFFGFEKIEKIVERNSQKFTEEGFSYNLFESIWICRSPLLDKNLSWRTRGASDIQSGSWT